MTMPSAVSANRVLLALKLSPAILRISLSIMVWRALDSVFWNAVRRACSRVCSPTGFIVSYLSKMRGIAFGLREFWRNAAGRRICRPS